MIEINCKYIPGNVYHQIKEILIKTVKIILLWEYIQVKTFLISLIMRYQRAILNAKFL